MNEPVVAALESPVGNPARVAIAQPRVIFGGRLHVILYLCQTLNRQGVVPDITTLGMPGTVAEIQERYGIICTYNVRLLGTMRRWKMPEELTILRFHYRLAKIAAEYDLVINSSNCLKGLPEKTRILSYVYFPREARVRSPLADIHRPEQRVLPLSRTWIGKQITRFAFALCNVKQGTKVVCLSEFTKRALLECYDATSFAETIDVVYPPVEIDRRPLKALPERDLAVASVGRFAPDKRQREQILLAATLPNYLFRLLGYAALNSAYFAQCEQLVRSHRLRNVQLLRNLPSKRVTEMLESSKYFLHALVNEPFGITTVQAIFAGCIPIVPDSGGQREIVNDPRLRYRELSQVPERIQQIETLSLDEQTQIVARLQARCANLFDAEIFIRKMGKIMASALNSNHASRRSSL